MMIKRTQLNSTVAALVLLVTFSLPLAAQDADIFERLRNADAIEAVKIDREVQLERSKSGSASMDLLLKRGRDAIEADDHEAAIEHLTALTDHAPDFAEGYHERARAYYGSGLYGPALDDLETTLRLNPDHYDAMFGLGLMLEEMGDLRRADKAYGIVLDYHPNHAQAKEGQARLRKSGIGRTL